MNERAVRFKARLERDVLRHPVIVANPYTAWFRRGEFDDAHARAFVQQFSVFSNQFLVAQLLKMLNADTVAEMRESKEILANEIGVGFASKNRARHDFSEHELGDPEGTIDGGTFRFRAAHFELLVRMARVRGLWTHVGRVNTMGRLARIEAMGAHSFDGSQFSRFPDKYIPPFLARLEVQQHALPTPSHRSTRLAGGGLPARHRGG